MSFIGRLPVSAALLLLATGCHGQRSAPPPAQGKVISEPEPGEAGHTHERGTMRIADAGPHHALLTAHLSKKGEHELDVLFETADEKAPKPVALPLASFTAQATAGGGDPHELKFEPAPADERPKDERATGACSHFVAKAPWLKPDDTLLVVARVPIEGKAVTVRWKDFDVKKYSHQGD